MSELTRENIIEATPETIWPFLVDPARHLEWMGTSAELDPRPGGAYRVLVAGEYPGVGEFVEAIEPEWLVFTFGWEQVLRVRRPVRCSTISSPATSCSSAAWSDPAMLAGTYRLPLGDVPGPFALGIHTVETVVHG